MCFEFYPTHCLVKYNLTQLILLSGVEKNGLYELQHFHFSLGVLCGSFTAAFSSVVHITPCNNY